MREIRFKFTGTLFYIVVIMNLLLTHNGLKLIGNISKNFLPTPKTSESTDNTQKDSLLKPKGSESTGNTPNISTVSPIISFISVLLSLSALLFTSNAIDYAISSIVCLWYEQVSCRFCDTYLSRLHELRKKYGQEIRGRFPHLNPIELENYLKKYEDVIHSYFWQRGPKPLIEWCVRRDSAFLTATTAYVGILLGWVLSVVLICNLSLSWGDWNSYFSIILLLFWWIFRINARRAFDEYWQMINLWYPNLLEASSSGQEENKKVDLPSSL